MNNAFKNLLDRAIYPIFLLLSLPFGWRLADWGFQFFAKAIGVGNKYHPRQSPMITVGEDRFLRRLLPAFPTTPTILDVGANIGDYSATIRRLRPDAMVYAFEPNPALVAHTTDRGTKFGFAVEPIALGDSPGSAALYDFAASGASSCGSLHHEQISLHGGAPIARTVEVTTLDAFTRERGIDHIDLLKIDTEGHDLAVLRGARKLLAARAIDIIQFEFIGVDAVLGIHLRDFAELLADFSLYRLMLSGRLRPLGPYRPLTWELYAEQNLIAIRHESLLSTWTC